ncbi:perlucin-like protein [Anopheles maculipalpis]|uniref:perlucin-like protein n=1 Tax=Anopheles maculipalpis TaxID=1496333 RepID=UPI002159AFB4|nr:perlucin-like protein [Anopheles maculipalpis]
MNFKLLFTVVTFAALASLVQGLKVFVAYKRSITAMQAMQVCKQQGGHLASIESAAEHDQVIAAITATGYPMDTPKYWLIGGSDRGIEGQWFWLGTNKEMKYKNFRSGEPNNDNNQDCLMITDVAGAKQWDDVWCDTSCYGYVCAYEIV